MQNPMLIEEHTRPDAECANHNCPQSGECQHYLFGTFDPDTVFSPRLEPGEKCGYYLPVEEEVEPCPNKEPARSA